MFELRRLFRNRKGEMSWAVIVGAVIAITVLFILIYLSVRGGKTGSSVFECTGGENMCKETDAECQSINSEYRLSMKPCTIKQEGQDDRRGRCCAKPLV